MKQILVCGCGAVGSNLTAFLAADVSKDIQITALDFDRVETRNVQANTQYYLAEQVGHFKTQALQYNIYKNYRRKIGIIDKEVEEDDSAFEGSLLDFDLVIDCFDNRNARMFLHEAALNAKSYSDKNMYPWELLHVGFSGKKTFSILWDDDYDVPEDMTGGFDICEMVGAGSWVKMIASLGSLVAQEFCENSHKLEFMGSSLSVRQLT